MKYINDVKINDEYEAGCAAAHEDDGTQRIVVCFFKSYDIEFVPPDVAAAYFRVKEVLDQPQFNDDLKTLKDWDSYLSFSNHIRTLWPERKKEFTVTDELKTRWIKAALETFPGYRLHDTWLNNTPGFSVRLVLDEVKE